MKFLSSEPALTSGNASIIDAINYNNKNKTAIDRLVGITRTAEKAGMAFVLFFAFTSIIIALATVRLAIYTAKDEIGVMRLVGASNAYIRAPFVVAGMIAGGIAGLITLVLLYPITWYLGAKTSYWFANFNVFSYYLSHFGNIFGIVMGSGILLSAVASYLAVRRYLRV